MSNNKKQEIMTIKGITKQIENLDLKMEIALSKSSDCPYEGGYNDFTYNQLFVELEKYQKVLSLLEQAEKLFSKIK